MAAGNRAQIKHELLVWGRQMSGMPPSVAAKKIGITEERLKDWEEGKIKPTIKQLRTLANVYKQSFAAFFLREAPSVPKLPLKDYRRLPGATSHEVSHEIIMDVRNALDRRLITLDLMQLNGIEIDKFSYQGSISEGVDVLSKRIRSDLDVTIAEQLKLRDPNKGFRYWREALEDLGVLVFQSSTIDIGDMRGYSVYDDYLPIIVVNRKDAEAARIFTMLHELVHIYLRASGLCDLEARTDIPPEEQRLEQFCNDVAANTLVPKEHFTNSEILLTNDNNVWSDIEISSLAKEYCVSREMIARRLVEVGRADKVFYRDKREQYLDEYKKQKASKSGGFVPPATDVLSKGGRKFSGLVIQSLKSKKINSTQASELLGVKLKHLVKISASLGY
ncbi:MAG: XRE family transcriptional regulator [Sedimenticola sp.]